MAKYKCKTLKGQCRQGLNEDGDGRKNRKIKDLADGCSGRRRKKNA